MRMVHPEDHTRTMIIDTTRLHVELYQHGSLVATRDFYSVEGMWRYLSANGWV